MENFREKKEILSETVAEGFDSARISDPAMFQRFLESLSPDQVTMLIASGALDDLISKDELAVQDLDALHPHPTERQGFDFEEWKNRPAPKIR